MLATLIKNAKQNKSSNAKKVVKKTTTFNIGDVKLKVAKETEYVKKHIDAIITHGEKSVSITIVTDLSDKQSITVVYNNTANKFERHTSNITNASELQQVKDIQDVLISVMKLRNNITLSQEQIENGSHVYDFICESNAEKIKSANSVRSLKNILIPVVRVEKTDEEKQHAKELREQKVKEKQKLEKSNIIKK
jgi:hypothetical protein